MTTQSNLPQPPSGLAPGTREHWIPWRMKLHGWDYARANAEFSLYERHMNDAAWRRYREALEHAKVSP